ncbi:MAG: peptidoglycan-associated lipoprotein Pal [Alphaproteobacteria bacterium]|nr:peptidoglycan-associated lipoprotein Pal [Alphaproteobacteria bacterium]
MKKLLSLFVALVALSGCSMFSSDGGLFSGADCESKWAREFAENTTDTVFFAFDSSELTAEAKSALDTQIAWLKRHEVNAIVQGYCDERGTREYNLALGERRANAVKQYLVDNGIAESRISTISYGKERPAVFGSNEAAWAQNRRAVTVISAAE